MTASNPIADSWREPEQLADPVHTVEETFEIPDVATRSGGHLDVPPADGIDNLRREIDRLRESWAQAEAARRMKESYRKVAARQRIPRRPWFLCSLAAGVSFPVVIGILYSQPVVFFLGAVLTVLGVVTLVLDAVARSRYASAQAQTERHLERMHREAGYRFRQAARAVQVDPADIEAELRRLEQFFMQTSAPLGSD